MTNWIRSNLFSKITSLVAVASFLTFFYFANVYAYSFKEPDTVASIMIPGYLVLFAGIMLVNLFYVMLYYFEPKFFMQFRTNGEEFPWKERPKWWAQNVNKFVYVYVRFILNPFLFIRMYYLTLEKIKMKFSGNIQSKKSKTRVLNGRISTLKKTFVF